MLKGSFFSHPLETISQAVITCLDPIEELYQSTKSGMANTETFQILSGVQQEGNKNSNIFNLFLDDALHIYTRADVKNQALTI